jgi:hypothetical protein
MGTAKAETPDSMLTPVLLQRHAKVELKIAGTPASVYRGLAAKVSDGLAALLDAASGRQCESRMRQVLPRTDPLWELCHWKERTIFPEHEGSVSFIPE